MRPEHEHYDTIEQWIRQSLFECSDFLYDRDLFQKELRRIWEQYDVPVESLYSFFRNIQLFHIKKNSHSIKTSMPELLDQLQNGTTILMLARQVNCPPHLLARRIVEATTTLKKKELTAAMRDPTKITADAITHDRWRSLRPILAEQVREAQDHDPLQSQHADKERHIVGIEMEVVLEHCLQEMGIPFETEADLRKRGTSKTPDILLSIPLGVQVPTTGSGEGRTEWKTICWIDSKAMFGDEWTHCEVLKQAETYLHRFGPGLVLYWFGHAPIDRLGDAHGDVVVVAWELPKIVMLPTGELIDHTCT